MIVNVLLTCWQRGLTGGSRPAFTTHTGELVYFIHTRPTIKARRGSTLVDVWLKRGKLNGQNRLLHLKWDCRAQSKCSRAGILTPEQHNETQRSLTGRQGDLHRMIAMMDAHLGRTSAGRSRSGSPDTSCSQNPAAHNQDRRGGALHGQHSVTCPVSSRWRVLPVLGRCL